MKKTTKIDYMRTVAVFQSLWTMKMGGKFVTPSEGQFLRWLRACDWDEKIFNRAFDFLLTKKWMLKSADHAIRYFGATLLRFTAERDEMAVAA
jgi:hypothetical protein